MTEQKNNGDSKEQPAMQPAIAEQLNAAREAARQVVANLNKALASENGEPSTPEESESSCRSADKSE
jgi:hypothetical protein